MDRNGFLTVFLFIFIVAEASNASLLSKHRILIGEPQKDNSTVPGKDSPVSSPPPPPPSPPPPVSSSGGNGSVPKVDDDPSKNKTDSVPPAKTPKADPGPRGLNNNTKTDEGKDPNKEKKDPNPTPESKEDPNPVPVTTPKQDPNSKQLKDEPNSASAPPEGGKVKNKEDSPEGGKVKNKEDSPEGGKVKSKEKKEKNDNVNNSQNAAKESCDGIIKTCKVKDVVVACIKNFDSGSKEVVILVQNVGDSTLKAKVSAENTKMDLEIAKHKNKKVNISLDIDRSTKITLNTGNGECELHMDPPVSDGNFFLRLPSYEKVVTPINGAYFLIVTVLIFGGTWAICKARKRKQRTGGGVPYQELEMGLPESVSATAVETAEGWDQGWDDDWDGDNAVKSPGAHLVGSISANGLTSRSANKDGWENDWDD